MVWGRRLRGKDKDRNYTRNLNERMKMAAMLRVMSRAF